MSTVALPKLMPVRMPLAQISERGYLRVRFFQVQGPEGDRPGKVLFNLFQKLGELGKHINSFRSDRQRQPQRSRTHGRGDRLNPAPDQDLWYQIMRGVPMPMTLHDRQGTLIYANPVACDWWNLPEEPDIPLERLARACQLYQTCTQQLYPVAAMPLKSALEGIAAGVEDMEFHREQRVIFLGMAATPLMAKGQVEGAIVTFQDLTATKQNALIRQREATQQLILDSIPDLLVRFSGDGVCLGILHSGDVPLLIAPESVIGKPMGEFLPPHLAQERFECIQKALETQTIHTHEYQLKIGDQIQYEESRIIPSGPHEVLLMIRNVTERKQAEQALQESQALYQSLTEVLPHCLYRTDLEGRLTFANSAFLKAVGQSLEECLGKTAYDFYPTDLAARYTADNQRVIATGQTLRRVEPYRMPKTEELIYVEVIKSPIFKADGTIGGIQGIFWDITDFKHAQEKLEAQQQFLQQVIDNMPSAVFVKDKAGRLLAVNAAAAAIHGQQPENILGKLETEFNPYVTKEALAVYHQINQRIMDERITIQEEQLITDINGESRWYQFMISPFLSLEGEVQGVIGNCIDITERKQMESALQQANLELERLATLDSLTQVANRRRFDEYLQQEWQRMIRESQPLSLILLDVDYFKAYNDYYGHQQGDECLVTVARAISQGVKRSVDLVARYGGEEFAVILPNTNRAGAINVAEIIQAQIRDLQIPHAQSVICAYVTVSLGIASATPAMGGSCHELIAAADAALYQAKRRGRDRYWVRII